jgi:hypothetical protein
MRQVGTRYLEEEVENWFQVSGNALLET